MLEAIALHGCTDPDSECEILSLSVRQAGKQIGVLFTKLIVQCVFIFTRSGAPCAIDRYQDFCVR